MKKLLFITFIAVLLFPDFLFSQNSFEISNYYSDNPIPVQSQNQLQVIQTTASRNITIVMAELKEKLVLARNRNDSNSGNKVFINIPDPDGGSSKFEVLANTTMHPDLQNKFEGIRTFDVIKVDNRSVQGKIDFTYYGFHAMIMSPEIGTYFIDPEFLGNDSDYLVYFKKNFITNKNMVCEFEGNDNYSDIPPPVKGYGTCELKTYRLALCATGEYTNFHGGGVANAASAQVTTMNRVNGIYERDMAVTMTIVANNNDIIYTNPATDPFSNGDAFAMLNECQATCDNVIGNSNYDIGHVFGTNSGGVAYLGIVCNNSFKGRGVTGSGAPIGDPFDIDYVAHEMGHQFGCNHSFNNSCGGNRNNSTAVEPGSGSTIMAYAGVCPPNVQSNSDDHFHGVNLQEMGAYTSTGTGGTCPVKTPLSNNAPEITGTNGNVFIPANTPFALTAVATDQDGDNLLYCWEQMDNQISTQPPSPTSTGGPNFRSNSPVFSPTRYFPDLQDLANNNVSQWEVISSVSRLFKFRIMVRDNAPGGGCNDYANVTVNTDAGSGPFVVTLPTANGISWTGSSSQTVTWDVANTNQSPVDATNVDIFLSIDGGNTYPTQLADNVPNDGSENISVPNTPSNNCRIMVMAENGTFFDISNNNFAITELLDDFTIATSDSPQTACTPDDATYTINIGQEGTYSDPVTLSVNGLPAGASSTFSVNPVTPVGSSVLTISGTEFVTPGEYNLSVEASSTTGTKSIDLVVSVVSGNVDAVNLLSPADQETQVELPINFSWSDAGYLARYDLEIATDSNFTNIVFSQPGIKNNSFEVNALQDETTFYWRITVYNVCATAKVSSTFSFSTITCIDADVPTVSATDLRICSGEEITLSIGSGNLNGAAEWEWYSASCGGTIIGTGNSINVSPETNTDYFVRGVGGCTTGSGSCGNVSIIVDQPYSTTENPDICEGETYTFPDGSTSSESTTNTSVFTDSNGCDSTIVTNLTVHPLYFETIDAVICDGDVYTFPDGSTSSESTSNTSVFTDSNGCDSTIVTELMVIILDNTVDGTTAANFIFSNQTSDATYQWIDCNNGNEPIPGATSQSFEITESGSYAVIVTSTINVLCEVTSDCIDVIFDGIGELEFNQFTVFPNPSDGKFKVTINTANYFDDLEIIDELGRSIYRANLKGQLQHDIDLTNMSKGIYYLKMINESEIKVVKLIKR